MSGVRGVYGVQGHMSVDDKEGWSRFVVDKYNFHVWGNCGW